MMKTNTILAVAAVSLALGGCMTVPDSHPLAGTRWQLAAIDAAGSTTALTPAAQAGHTLAFAAGGEAQVQLDCNRGRTTWSAGQASGGTGEISFGPVASTRMLCPEPSFGNALASGLGAAQRYSKTPDGQLIITATDLRLTFIAAPPK